MASACIRTRVFWLRGQINGQHSSQQRQRNAMPLDGQLRNCKISMHGQSNFAGCRYLPEQSVAGQAEAYDQKDCTDELLHKTRRQLPCQHDRHSEKFLKNRRFCGTNSGLGRDQKILNGAWKTVRRTLNQLARYNLHPFGLGANHATADQSLPHRRQANRRITRLPAEPALGLGGRWSYWRRSKRRRLPAMRRRR